jgi:hypothetical protein
MRLNYGAKLMYSLRALAKLLIAGEKPRLG